jgi:hypothetical protein
MSGVGTRWGKIRSNDGPTMVKNIDSNKILRNKEGVIFYRFYFRRNEECISLRKDDIYSKPQRISQCNDIPY